MISVKSVAVPTVCLLLNLSSVTESELIIGMYSLLLIGDSSIGDSIGVLLVFVDIFSKPGGMGIEDVSVVRGKQGCLCRSEYLGCCSNSEFCCMRVNNCNIICCCESWADS